MKYKIRYNQSGGGIDEILKDVTCPLAMHVFNDPVIASDGITYEKKYIEEYFRMNEDDPILSPITKEPLKSIILYPNQAIKSIIINLKEYIDTLDPAEKEKQLKKLGENAVALIDSFNPVLSEEDFIWATNLLETKGLEALDEIEAKLGDQLIKSTIDDKSLLTWSIEKKLNNIAMNLLEKDADVYTENAFKKALKIGMDNKLLLDKFFEKGLDINSSNLLENDYPLLWNVTFYRNTELLKYLLDMGANPLLKIDDFMSAFSIAVDYCIKEYIDLFFKYLTPEQLESDDIFWRLLTSTCQDGNTGKAGETTYYIMKERLRLLGRDELPNRHAFEEYKRGWRWGKDTSTIGPFQD